MLTTSIHFFDHTAHEYVNGICDDLGMKYVDGYSAAMYDLLQEEERRGCCCFSTNSHAVETRLATPQAIPARDAGLPGVRSGAAAGQG